MKRWIPIFVVLALLLTMPGFAFAADESSDAKKLSLSGHAEGFGDADLWISGTALDAVANITEDDMLLLRVDGVVRGEPVNAVLGIKEDGVYLAFPDAIDEHYFINTDTLKALYKGQRVDFGFYKLFMIFNKYFDTITMTEMDDGILFEAVRNSINIKTDEEQLAVIDLLVTDTDEQVELPDGDWTELKTEEEIKEAAQAVHDAVFANAAA